MRRPHGSRRTQGRVSAVSDPARILLIRPSALGDVCRTVPVAAALKRRYPAARLDWLVNDAFAPAVASHPDVAAVLEFPRRRFGRWWKSLSAAGAMRDWLLALRRSRYDLVVDCQGLLRSGGLALATGARRRVGYANAAEFGWLGLNDRVWVPEDLHAVDRMMALARHVGADAGAPPDMRLYASSADRSSLDPRLSGARYALLAPTSRWEGKRWPMERFGSLATRLLDDGLVDRVAIVGASGEREQCAPLGQLAARDSRVVDLVGATSVGGLMAAVERAAIVVANDSAALHMAVGFDRPLVALFGPTRIDRVGPYGRAHDVIQKVRPGERLDHKDDRLGRGLMQRITLEEVLEAAASRVGKADTITRC